MSSEREQDIVADALAMAQDALKDCGILPTWAIKSETDSSAHHHSERRADEYDAKVRDWQMRAAEALKAVRAALAAREGGSSEPVAWMVQAHIPELGGWQNEAAHTDEEEAAAEARAYRSKPHSIPARVVPLYARLRTGTET